MAGYLGYSDEYQYLLGKVSTGDPKKALVEFMYQYLLGKVSTGMDVRKFERYVRINIYQVRYLRLMAGYLGYSDEYQYLLGKVST